MSLIPEEVDPTYAAACSDVTLCSNSKGFFKNFAEQVLALANDDWLQQLENLEEKKKIRTVLENKEVMNAITEVLARIEPLHRAKDARISNERRLAASAALQAGDLKKALSLASQALFRAPMTGVEEVVDGGISLANALWLRSEVLLKCGRPNAALEDLKMALKERLPAKMRAQYYWRMGHCYKGAGEPSRAKVSYELAGRLLGNNEEDKTQLAQDIASLDYNVQPKQSPDKKGVSLTGGSKLSMPSMSKLLKINEEENKGRFAVANSSIKTGEVLLKDSPYAACLLSDYYGSHCLNCFKRFEDCLDEAPVWCPKCSGVAFCSAKCRDIALSTYHVYECPFLDLFIGSGMSILSHIALRMVTQAGLNTCLSIHSKYIHNKFRTLEGAALNDIEGVSKKTKNKSRRERLNRSKKGQKSFENSVQDEDNKDSDMNPEEKMELKAAQIYSLCTHSEQRKGGDYLKRIIMAMFMAECLKKSGFFSDHNQGNLRDAHIAVVELIVRNLQLLQFNAHEIYETIQGEHMFSGSKPVYIAVGIYPTGALFNHECYPAVARYFEGRDIILRATRPLSPGEVVSENYGPHFMTRTLKERQRSLACRYWFKCECIACKEDWPTMKQMKSGPPFVRCPNLSCEGKFRAVPQSLPSKCVKCSTSIDEKLVKIYMENVDKCITLYQEGAKLMDEEKPQDAIAVMTEAIDLFHEVARGPHLETHIAQESLRSCFAAFGNIHVIQTEQNEKN